MWSFISARSGVAPSAPFEAEFDQAIDQLGERESADLEKSGVHRGGGEARDGVELAEPELAVGSDEEVGADQALGSDRSPGLQGNLLKLLRRLRIEVGRGD